MILDNWTTYTSGELVEAVCIFLYRVAGTIPSLIRVQARAIDLHHRAPVKVVRTILRNDHYLRSAISPVLCAVWVGRYCNFFNGLLVWSYDRSTAPRQTIYFNAID